MNIIRKEQDFWKVKNTTDDCVMSLINSGNLQAQAALDAPVYYNYPDHLVLVGSPTRLCDPLGPPKAQYAVLGRGGRRKRLKPQSGFLQRNAELKQLTDMLETMDPTEYGTTLDVQNDLSGSLQYSTDREEHKYNIMKDGYLLPEIIITPTCE